MKDIYQKQASRVRSYLLRKTHAQPATIDDLLQDIFAKFYRSEDQTVQRLFLIAKCRVSDYFRRDKAEQTNYEIPDMEMEDSHLRAEEDIETQGRQYESFLFLDAEEQRLLDLRYLHDLPIQECANRLGLTLSRVNRKLKKSMQKVRRHYHLGHTNPRRPLFDLAEQRLNEIGYVGRDFDDVLEDLISSVSSEPPEPKSPLSPPEPEPSPTTP